MKRNLRTIVIDDHPLMAQVTKGILEKQEAVEVVGVAKDGKGGLKLVQELEPDLVFLDYQLPDLYGTEVAEQIKQLNPRAHIVILSGYDMGSLYNRLLEIGVSGIISKEADEAAIVNMVNCIQHNYTIIPIPLFRQMKLTDKYAAIHSDSELTSDEVAIMTLLLEGRTLEQIGEHIHVSKRSVDNYLKRIYDKLGVKNRAQAIQRFVTSDYYMDEKRR